MRECKNCKHRTLFRACPRCRESVTEQVPRAQQKAEWYAAEKERKARQVIAIKGMLMRAKEAAKAVK